MTLAQDPRIISRFGFDGGSELVLPKALDTKALKQIDAWEFCRHRITVDSNEFSVPNALKAADIPRFVEELLSMPSDLHWHISGLMGSDGKCRVSLSGQFTATRPCMKCGQSVSEPVSFNRRLQLCKSEKEAEAADLASDENDDDVDFVAASGKVNLIEWLEDELLLSLPMFTKHDECSADPTFLEYRQGHADSSDEILSGDNAEPEDTRSPSPFAVLASLKKPRT